MSNDVTEDPHRIDPVRCETRADASPTYFTVVSELRRTTAALEWAHNRLRQCGVEWNRQVEEMEQAGLTLPDCTVRSYHGCVNRPILPD